MKRTKTISLNGTEYTLELNRDSFAQIDKICNIKKLMKQLQSQPYEYIEEIDDNYNPLENPATIDDIQKDLEEKTINTKKLYENSFFIWLYPNHKLKISEVKEILKPYFENDEKFAELDKIFNDSLEECVSIKDNMLSKN